MAMTDPKFLRRGAAAEYLQQRYGFCTPKSLSKLACVGGGPVFRKIGTLVVYHPADLDAWAQSKMTAPLRSTSEAQIAA
jgi:hypothetical protein